MQAVDAPADTRELRVATQFVLDTRDIAGATTVSIVGDFNDWNQTTTPLVIEHGAWTTTVPLAPGRHVYAFVVNGERWIVDPRAPQAPDSDFGRPSSVIIVRAP
jgi:1,4-alpha-glucan branching enzyme